jgi:hypothetical protein
VTDKPFEVVAECAMAGFPTSADMTRVAERIERARRRSAAIARAAVQTPAVYKDRAYTLVTRFLVWATDGPRAMDTVGDLLQGAGIHCRGMHLSGRALVAADLQRPAAEPEPRATGRPAAKRQPVRKTRRGSKAKLIARRKAARPKATKRKKSSGRKGRPRRSRGGRAGTRRARRSRR